MENMMISPGKPLCGEVLIPGDKSISHRSIMLSGLATEPIIIKNFLHAHDCLSTISCMQNLGVKIEIDEQNNVIVTGNGLSGLSEPSDVLDAGNSGTTMRLLAGILSAQPFFSVLTGDESLRKRPMSRIVEPLTRMGGRIFGRNSSEYAPLAIMPSEKITGIAYHLPVASAQIKSAVLLAGLFGTEETLITEPYISRDHTEKMLAMFGVPVLRIDTSVTMTPVHKLIAPKVIEVPGDISSAAFWMVAASIIPDSMVTLRNVGINHTRTGILEVLQRMGGNIDIINKRMAGEEPVADIIVTSSDLNGVAVESELIPRLIDEIPVLAVAALFARGRTIISGAGELRFKETDRLAAIAKEFLKLGAIIEETDDGLIIEGRSKLGYGHCDSHGDHRIAMALAIAGTAAQGISIRDSQCVGISYPNFFTTLNSLNSRSGE